MKIGIKKTYTRFERYADHWCTRSGTVLAVLLI